MRLILVVARFLGNILYAEAPCQVIGITLEFPEKCSLLFSENGSIFLVGYTFSITRDSPFGATRFFPFLA
ncbi:hypothetical protein PNH38_00055 [Anoxybacillus rupiensis]|uniref:Secreted protein n=1 Tax=Anoxybacteroides rupiense TaxID=311460 RepID=A0ABT5VYW8_9BACL|nr:hypothetical protein [Anoxybacillus rupiensis]